MMTFRLDPQVAGGGSGAERRHDGRRPSASAPVSALRAELAGCSHLQAARPSRGPGRLIGQVELLFVAVTGDERGPVPERLAPGLAAWRAVQSWGSLRSQAAADRVGIALARGAIVGVDVS